jgi:hypothetical protein
VKATCQIAAEHEIIGPLIWELMGKRDDGHGVSGPERAPALDDG